MKYLSVEEIRNKASEQYSYYANMESTLIRDETNFEKIMQALSKQDGPIIEIGAGGVNSS